MLKDQSYPEIAVKNICPPCVWLLAHLQVWSFNLQRLLLLLLLLMWLGFG